MIMTYGGYLVMSGTLTDKKTGKEIAWKNIKLLLSPDGTRAGLYKIPFSDETMDMIRHIPLGTKTDVCFDFYGNVEKLLCAERVGNHA